MARPARVTHSQILEAARLTFLELGPSAPLSAIAARLGVTAPALSHRVGSKEALFSQALESPLPSFLEALRRGPPKTNPREQLEALLLQINAFLRSALPNIVVMRHSRPRPKRSGVPPTVALRSALRDWLVAMPTRVAPGAMAEAVLGAMEARVFNRYLGGSAFAPGDDGVFLTTLLDAFFEHAEAS